ncbi:DEKNAAC103142 [Brettanomyces naardenensis]|uniref:NAD-dependent protein deacetylase n=1 Tax=Brettanomyces naardenensis TaxID=13370 RepID=A0A448YME5_BRENA|nr:DEKNAAC103142 [Brettanomyces naardenensis]
MDSKLEHIAQVLAKDGSKVVFFVGAGISTNCGIPDFRSPKTGLYSNLQRLDLPFPEAVFDIDYFRENPKAFYTLAEEMYPGKYLPSRFHYFIRLCQEKHVLKRCYTQNIDTLERVAGVKGDLVVEAHGSFTGNHCIDCHAGMDDETWKKLVKKGGIPKCPVCHGYVKPDIVFFGESLPAKFFDLWDEDSGDDYDLAIVAGTSLAVYPFATLPAEVSKSTTRVLINKESCGDFEENPRDSDLLLMADCDSTATKLADLLGWSEELEELIEAGKKKLDVEGVKVKETVKEPPQTIVKKDTKKESSASPLQKAEETAAGLAAKVAEAEKEKLPAIKKDKEVEELTKAIENIDIKDGN